MTKIVLLDNAKYTSPEIQNQMIQIVGSVILDEIVHRVKKPKLYSIIADETLDNSKTEQFSLLVRYVWNGKVEERLLGGLPAQETTAEVLFHTVCSKVKDSAIMVQAMFREFTLGYKHELKNFHHQLFSPIVMPMC